MKILNSRGPTAKVLTTWEPIEFISVTLDLRKDPDVLARVLEEFDPSGTQEIFPGQVGLRWMG